MAQASSDSTTDSPARGYYRFPTAHRNVLVFVCEDDLWTVSIEGGVARRLTSNLAATSAPRLSPCGKLLAFTGREEGPEEVYVMPSGGGEATRLTYQGQQRSVEVVGWSADGKSIFYASSAASAFGRCRWLWKVPVAGGEPQRLPYGPANHIAYGSKGMVIGRSTGEPAMWKRYRGGTAGQLWIDVQGKGQFQLLAPVIGNLTTPMWIGKRIYFIADHEGVGNIYSCLPSGNDVQRHTHHDTYYCRSAQTDGVHIVYHAGADLYVYEVASDNSRRIEVEFRSARTQCQRKFVDVPRYLQEYTLAPDGHALLLTVRGKPFTMANWEGAVSQHGERDGVRYRLTQWLSDGKRLISISDVDGEEKLEIHTCDGRAPPLRLKELDIGQAFKLVVCPYTKDAKKDLLLITNNRFELLHIDLHTQQLRVLDKSEHHHISGVSWSPDGRWCAYAFFTTQDTRAIKICKLETGETWFVTKAEFNDVSPVWDTQGRYLYFLAQRSFDAFSDMVSLHASPPLTTRPMLVTLRKNLPSPFIPQPRPLAEEDKKDEERKDKACAPFEIDLDGITQRVVAFPCPHGYYKQIAAIENKVILMEFPAQVHSIATYDGDESEPQGKLIVYDFAKLKQETLVSEVDSFQLARDNKTLAYRNKDRLRVIKAGEKPPEQDEEEDEDAVGRHTGWVDLARAKVSIVPVAEWRQMYREAWCAQRDYFWTEDMSGVDWQRVYQRYLPLLERVATRGEFSDLLWEMQGELGTSHAYVFGGDYRASPDYAQGFLGADFVYDAEQGGYRVEHIPCGDSWEEGKDSPLNAAGADLHVGDVLLAVGGQRVSRTITPQQLLVNLAAQDVQVNFKSAASGKKRVMTIKTLSSEKALRYRDWVNRNRHYVCTRSNGQVGYIHIPHMMVEGYAEFHRAFVAELHHPALLIDVRNNGGGYISEYILEKLTRRCLGYDIRRWGTPIAYPYRSLQAPLVAVTDEYAGSDGDIFSHCFKLLKLGKLIGKRTWGGVIGIDAGCELVDGGCTTQPGYSFWFTDVGWKVENYGTDPDIEVNYRPQDYVAGNDPQLDRGIAELIKQLETNPPKTPSFDQRPHLPLPRLPKV